MMKYILKSKDQYYKTVTTDAYYEIVKLGYKPFVVCLYGSQNYGLETPNSDYDFKAVILPTIEDIINNKKPISIDIEYEGGLIDIKDIRLMWDNYKKQNTNFIETLFTPYYSVNFLYINYWDQMRAIANDIAYADQEKHLKAFYGMALQKYHALCHPYPSKMELIEKYGYDAKQLSHICRLHYMAKKYLLKEYYGDILIPDSETAKELKEIKTYQKAINAEIACLDAKYEVDKLKELVDNALTTNNYQINIEVYNKMDKIKSQIIKQSFKEALIDG